MKYIKLIFLFSAILFSSHSFSYTASLDDTAKVLMANLEKSLAKLYSEQKLTAVSVKKILDNELLPMSNTKYFTYKVLSKHLVKMSDEQKVQYINELTTNLLSSYANVLIHYKNEKILVEKAKLQPSGKMAEVTIEITGPNKSVNAVTKWLLIDGSEWQIYDIVIEGISLLQSKQVEINKSISTIGIQPTLEKLKTINSKYKN
ncbi:MAG: MlaC/ttg2D family ABC transporter substrate-binding protein [Thalassotalea sp.]